MMFRWQNGCKCPHLCFSNPHRPQIRYTLQGVRGYSGYLAEPLYCSKFRILQFSTNLVLQKTQHIKTCLIRRGRYFTCMLHHVCLGATILLSPSSWRRMRCHQSFAQMLDISLYSLWKNIMFDNTSPFSTIYSSAAIASTITPGIVPACLDQPMFRNKY